MTSFEPKKTLHESTPSTETSPTNPQSHTPNTQQGESTNRIKSIGLRVFGFFFGSSEPSRTTGNTTSHAIRSAGTTNNTNQSSTFSLAGLWKFVQSCTTYIINRTNLNQPFDIGDRTPANLAAVSTPTVPSTTSPTASPKEPPSATRVLAQSYGWKTANLMCLSDILTKHPDLNASVPFFQGIKHEVIFDHIKKHFREFQSDWDAFTNEYSKNSDLKACQTLLDKISSQIKNVFIEHPMTDPAIDELCSKNERLMVRSTGREDDPGEGSEGIGAVINPGGNLSVSNVMPTPKSINEAIGDVVASYVSMKSLTQRQALGDDITSTPFMPILLQVMVGESTAGPPPISGVMYTQEPDLLTPGVVQINAMPGHAEAVVAGSAPADLFYVQDDSLHHLIQEKPTRKAPSAEGGLEWKENPKEQRLSPSLNPTQAKQLANIGRQIESDFGGRPLDIEWSLDPQTGHFHVFQARVFKPSPYQQASYIDPTKMNDLANVRPISITVAAAGASVMVLNKDNTQAFSSADTAIGYCKQHSDVKVIILRNPIGRNSHEAGFFRERGISVIHPEMAQYDSLVNTLKSKTILVDVGEGVCGVLPNDENIESFIKIGLRRHLAPKMESNPAKIPEDQAKILFEDLHSHSTKCNRTAAEKKINDAPGRNLLDKCLNAYELSDYDNERAFILSKVLTITKNLVDHLPPARRSDFFNKVVTNAMDVWAHRTSGELASKFAMNWLRSSLLQNKPSNVLDSDTLYSILGEKAEKKRMGIAVPESSHAEHLEVFLRSSKLLFNKESRDKWTKFCNDLNENQLQQLSKIFVKLGPGIIELWLNSIFLKVAESETDSSKILNHLVAEMNRPDIENALKIAAKAQATVNLLSNESSRFENPNEYDNAKNDVIKVLIDLSNECIEGMNNQSGLGAMVLTQAFTQILTIYDDCIKALSGSPLYEEKSLLKATRFAEILVGYIQVATNIMKPEVLQDKSLKVQAQILCKLLDRLIEEATKHLNTVNTSPAGELDQWSVNRLLKDLLAVSNSFNVTSVSLGSNNLAPDRILGLNLHALFTTAHQSALTAAKIIGNKGGIQFDQLPEPLKEAVTSLMSLNLDNEMCPQPVIQAIDFVYPNLKVTLNCPLNYHSAMFTLTGKMDREGNLAAMEFEGMFVAPQQRDATARTVRLGVYALNASYYGGVQRAEPFSPKITDAYTCFQWGVPVNDCKDWKGVGHLQNMINFLQKQTYLPRSNDDDQLHVIFRHPELAKSIGVTIASDRVIKDVNSNQDSAHLDVLLKLSPQICGDIFHNRLTTPPSMDHINALMDTDAIWEKNKISDVAQLLERYVLMGNRFPTILRPWDPKPWEGDLRDIIKKHPKFQQRLQAAKAEYEKISKALEEKDYNYKLYIKKGNLKDFLEAFEPPEPDATKI